MADLARDVRFARKRQRKGDKGRFERALGQRRAERVQQARIVPRRTVRAQSGCIVDERPGGQRLQRLPAIEGIRIVRGEEPQIVGRKVC